MNVYGSSDNDEGSEDDDGSDDSEEEDGVTAKVNKLQYATSFMVFFPLEDQRVVNCYWSFYFVVIV